MGAELGVMLLEVVLHMVVLVHMKGQYRILPNLDLQVVQVEVHIKGQQVEIFIHQVPVDQIEDNLKPDQRLFRPGIHQKEEQEIGMHTWQEVVILEVELESHPHQNQSSRI